MVNRENDMEVMDGQNPFLLRFEPLCFLESPTLRTMAILAGFEMKLPFLALVTNLQNSTHCRRATIDNRAHGFRLLIRKPMSTLVFANVFAENLSHIEA